MQRKLNSSENILNLIKLKAAPRDYFFLARTHKQFTWLEEKCKEILYHKIASWIYIQGDSGSWVLQLYAVSIVGSISYRRWGALDELMKS